MSQLIIYLSSRLGNEGSRRHWQIESDDIGEIMSAEEFAQHLGLTTSADIIRGIRSRGIRTTSQIDSGSGL